MKTHPRSTAFTILEVMIALSIFAMVLVTIYSVWNGILRASSAARSAADSAQRARIAIKTIEDTLTCAQMFSANMPPNSTNADYSFLGEGSADFAALSFVAHIPPTVPGYRHFGNDLVRRVSFGCQPSTNAAGSMELIMVQRPLLTPATEETEAYTNVLAKDVQTFLVDFWGQPSDKQGFEWVMDWGPSTSNNRNASNSLPRLVRIALGVGKTGKKGEAQDVVYRVIALPASAVAPEWQMPLGPMGAGFRPNPNQQNPNQQNPNQQNLNLKNSGMRNPFTR